jgi:hypothetical protein
MSSGTAKAQLLTAFAGVACLAGPVAPALAAKPARAAAKHAPLLSLSGQTQASGSVVNSLGQVTFCYGRPHSKQLGYFTVVLYDSSRTTCGAVGLTSLKINVKGPTGPTGPQGLQGLQGVQGATGQPVQSVRRASRAGSDRSGRSARSVPRGFRERTASTEPTGPTG